MRRQEKEPTGKTCTEVRKGRKKIRIRKKQENVRRRKQIWENKLREHTKR